MQIDDLCQLCKIYERNKITIEYETGQLSYYSSFSDESVAIKDIKRLIDECEKQNKEIELRLASIISQNPA